LGTLRPGRPRAGDETFAGRGKIPDEPMNAPRSMGESAPNQPVLLEVRNLTVSYGVIVAIHEISLQIRQGEIVTLIGTNGAGKTTTLRAISGLLKAKGGQILYQGADITNLPPHQIVQRGLCQVPEGRMVFTNLTVLENLNMGAYLQKDKAVIQQELEYVFGIFPRLKERLKQVAGTLSGGEQQMLAIGRALMSKPRFLMLDEPSLGIAPILVKTIFEKVIEINQRHGITILLVEQNAKLALEISQYGYVLETGRVSLQDKSAALRENPQVKSAYLGGG
jgi:branched-chain amino acid transport system ATP-binding protein